MLYKQVNNLPCFICVAQGKGATLAWGEHHIIFRSHTSDDSWENRMPICRHHSDCCHSLVKGESITGEEAKFYQTEALRILEITHTREVEAWKKKYPIEL